MKILNSMNRIHDKKLNNIDECKLLHVILNSYKRTKYINIHYSPILHGCMNMRGGKAKFNIF